MEKLQRLWKSQQSVVKAFRFHLKETKNAKRLPLRMEGNEILKVQEIKEECPIEEGHHDRSPMMGGKCLRYIKYYSSTLERALQKCN